MKSTTYVQEVSNLCDAALSEGQVIRAITPPLAAATQNRRNRQGAVARRLLTITACSI